MAPGLPIWLGGEFVSSWGVILGVFETSVEGCLPAFRFRYREEKVAREPTSMPM